MKISILAMTLALAYSGLTSAATPQQILAELNAKAGGSSVARGEKLYRGQFGGEIKSCMGCHTEDARASGRHVKTHKAIEPLAPVANKERFTDMAKVEKWFRRNCKEVLARECTAQEKADFTAYMLSLK